MNENFKNSFIGKKIKDIDIDNFGIEITLEDNSKFDYCSKEVFLQKVVKDKIKKAIDFINDENNFFEDGENWQNVLKIKEILEEN